MQNRQTSLTALRARLYFGVLAALAIFANFGSAQAQPYIAGVTAQATSSQVFTAGVLTNNAGLTETPPGSGVYQLTTNEYVDGGAMWNSGYISYGPDENPYVQFDLGATYTVNKFHVWNFNGAGGYAFRGFRQVTVQISANGTTWKSVAQRFVFAKAPGVDTYTGEEYAFQYPVSARYIRFIADSTHRNFAGRELAGLGKVKFHSGGTAITPPATGGIFPSDSGVINVKLPPYNAVGDGDADDSNALQNAINDWQGTRQTIYLPAGTYKVTRAIKLSNSGFGFTNFRGESAANTIILLSDNTFTDPNNPQPVLSAANNRNGQFISADWFNNNFGFFTINVGSGNPGAVGLQFYSNNVGSVRNVTLTSEDGGGKIALDLGYDDQNGPLLAKNISIYGFETGINAGASVNSQVLENITIDSPSVIGIRNGGQCLSIRNYTFSGYVPALDTTGHVALLTANLTNTGGDDDFPAITNNEALYARGVTTQGFGGAIQNNFGGTASPTSANVSEFISHPIISQFANRPKSLTLPIKNTPEPPTESPTTWANVRNFRLVTDPDDTLAVQRAIDSGATTVYFPSQGTYYLDKVRLRGAVRRIVGMHATILRSVAGGGFQLDTGAPTIVWIDQVGGFNNILEVVNNSSRTLTVRDCQDPNFILTGTGETFFENVSTGPVTLSPGQKVWARQLNIEGTQTKITNNGGTFWVLGFKSEAGGTLIATTGGGKSELLGGLYYSQASGSAPMLTTVDSSVSFSLGEVNFASDPFQLIVQETRGGVTRTLSKNQTPQRRFVPGSMLPLYVGYDDATYLAPPYNVQASGGAGQISLTWDALPRATSYLIQRATTANGTYSTLATVTTNSYLNTGLAANKTYFYKIAANYPAGRSPYSAPVSGTTDYLAVYRINCGGGDAAPFTADQFAVGGNTAGTGSPIDVTGVSQPAPQSVYQSERWGDCRYDITGLTPGATYKLRLHFAEFIVGGTNQRVFNVNVNGTPFLTNFDIIAVTGGINRAVVRETTAPADATGKISIAFVSVIAAAKISGIEVILP